MQNAYNRALRRTSSFTRAEEAGERAVITALLQKALKQEGHYSGEIDGISGGGTKQAIASYAKRNSIVPDDVMGHIMSRSMQARTPIADKDIPQEVKDGIARLFIDPSSVQFRDFYSFKRRGLGTIYCGEANAKNSYGAYVGFTHVYARSYDTAELSDNMWGNTQDRLCCTNRVKVEPPLSPDGLILRAL